MIDESNAVVGFYRWTSVLLRGRNWYLKISRAMKEDLEYARQFRDVAKPESEGWA